MIKISTLAVSAVLLLGSMEPAKAQNMSPGCNKIYWNYKKAKGPKAFAVGNNGSCSWWRGANGGMAPTQHKAFNDCKRQGKGGCRVVESAF